MALRSIGLARTLLVVLSVVVLLRSAISAVHERSSRRAAATSKRAVASGTSKEAAAAASMAEETSRRRAAIRDAFLRSWAAYERFAWGHDELHPLTNRSNDVWGGFAVTMVDSLDTAKIMGCEAEFGRAVAWLDGHFTMQRDHYVSVFELSIRVLGGLLSAYDLSRDPRLLRVARRAARTPGWQARLVCC